MGAGLPKESSFPFKMINEVRFSSVEVKGKHMVMWFFHRKHMIMRGHLCLSSVAGNKSPQLSKKHLLFLGQQS